MPWLNTSLRSLKKEDKLKNNGTKEINWSCYRKSCLNIANRTHKISKHCSTWSHCLN